MSGGGPGRRAIVRWAVRLFRRDWRQQILVLVLMTIAIGSAIAMSTIAVNAASSSAGRFGSGGTLVHIDGADATAAQGALEAAKERFGVIDPVAHTTSAVPGSLQRVDVRDQNPTGPYSAPMLRL